MTTTARSASARLHPVVTGALLGLSWGIAMRVWMRFITTDPEFTWSGTGYILGATTLAGLLLGLGWARRAKAKGNWWRLTGLSMLPLGVAAGRGHDPFGLSRGACSWPQELARGGPRLASCDRRGVSGLCVHRRF